MHYHQGEKEKEVMAFSVYMPVVVGIQFRGSMFSFFSQHQACDIVHACVGDRIVCAYYFEISC